ncbi:MAG: hypothetical protein ABWY97_05345 [Thermoleophilaceae bacterium]
MDISGVQVMVVAGVPMVMAMGSGIRTIAILATGIVLLGFALFAVDEMDRGSQNQQNALASELESASESPTVISPDPREERMREQHNGDFREAIDDANDVLLAPFADLVDSENAWVANGVPTILGLLVYGLLLGLVANMLPKRRAHGGDWRTA